MAVVRVDTLRRAFTGGTQAVNDVSFELAAGELYCLLGPSGCGKSTLLRLIGGYLKPDAGRVWINEHDVTREPPERRNTGMVFQNYALFPHLNALENVAFGRRVKGVAKAERLAKAHEMLDWVGLTESERSRRPSQLSGGQQQRVALARALGFGPSLLMLDEPFANLDRLLRERLREELKQVQRRAGITTILVTHDREEAFALGDRIAIMHQGRLLQVGSPEEVYARPASALVADFLGHRNLFKVAGVRADAVVVEGGAALPLPADKVRAGDHLLIKPERLRLHCDGTGGMPAAITHTRFAGAHRVIGLQVQGGLSIEAQVSDDVVAHHVHDAVRLEVPSGALAVIPS